MIASLALQLFSLLGSANPAPSVLNIRLQTNRPFTVQFDDQHFTVPDVDYSIRGIEAGEHYLVVSRLRTFVGYPTPQRQIVFAGYVNIPCASIVNSVVRSYDRIDFVRVDPIFQPPAPCSPQLQHPVLYTECAPAPLPICESEFREISTVIEQQWFENTRLEVAQNVLSQKYLSTEQVRSLMQLFSFDSSRLEFAKFAYSRTVDRQNYYRTFSALSFDSSVRELSSYISRPS